MKRAVSSDIWVDEDFAELSTNAKLLLLGIMTRVNDIGEMNAHPAMLHAWIMFSILENQNTIPDLLSEIIEHEFIELYENESGKTWLRLSPEWLGKRIGTLSKDAYGYHWKGLSAEARRRDGNKCIKCEKVNGRLIAHHIKPLGRGGKNELDNLTTLCPSCHRIAHAELGDF